MIRQDLFTRSVTLVGTLILATGAFAQDAPEENDATVAEPNTGMLHLSLGADFSNAYFFRGYLQNKDQTNSQFWMDVGIDLAETGGTKWTANVGMWNAFDDGDNAGTTDSVTEKWYESDLYFGLGFEHDKWSMPSHIKAILTQTSLSIPIVNGRLGLGTWQGIYLWEHRTSPHRRRVLVQLIG